MASARIPMICCFAYFCTMKASEHADGIMPGDGHQLPKYGLHLLLLSLAFAAMVPLGAGLVEWVKASVASGFGYVADYKPFIGRSLYYNPEWDLAFEQVRAAGDQHANGLLKSTLLKKREQDLAILNLSGRMFTLLFSTISILIYLKRRRQALRFSFLDWGLLLGGLFFMRDLVVDAHALCFHFYLCDEIIQWKYLGLPFIWATRISCLFYTALFAYVFLKVPSRLRFMFFLAGLSGSAAGLFLWLYLPMH